MRRWVRQDRGQCDWQRKVQRFEQSPADALGLQRSRTARAIERLAKSLCRAPFPVWTEPGRRYIILDMRCIVGILASGLLFTALTVPDAQTSGPKKSGSKKFRVSGAEASPKEKVFFDVKWEVENAGAGEPYNPISPCGRPCQGKKHTKHSDCDSSCDSQRCFHESFGADAGHHLVQRLINRKELGEEGNDPPKRSHAMNMNSDFERFGMPNNMSAEGWLHILLSAASESAHLRVPCWNKTPCSFSKVTFPTEKKIIKVEYELTIEREVDGRVVVEKGPKRTLRWLVTQLPPTPEGAQTEPPTIHCKCEAVQTPPQQGMVFGSKGEGEFAYATTGGQSRTITGQDIGRVVTGIAVHNMNQATVSLASGEFDQFVIPAGWEMECTSGGGQNVQLQQDIVLTLMPWGQTFTFAHGGGAPFADDQRLRIMCLQIEKPEPKEGMKYRLVPPSSPALARLARMTRESRIRGPWDQTRLWIATDNASLERIQKVLIPSPDERIYLREMHQAYDANAINISNPETQEIMEFRLAFAENVDIADAEWLVRSKFRVAAKRSSAEMRECGTDIKNMFASRPAESAAFVSKLARAVCEATDGKEVLTAVWLLNEATPEGHRKAAANSDDALIVASTVLEPCDPAVATAILAWLEKTRPPYAAVIGLNFHESLPSGLRERARRLAVR